MAADGAAGALSPDAGVILFCREDVHVAGDAVYLRVDPRGVLVL